MEKNAFSRAGRLFVSTAMLVLASCSAQNSPSGKNESDAAPGTTAPPATAAAKFAYIPLQGSAQVVVVDLASMKEVKRIKTDGRSIDTRITPDYSKVYVINVFNPHVSVIRARCPDDRAKWTDAEQKAGKCVSNSRLGTITVDDRGAYYFSISKDGSRMYLVSDSGINIIDTRTDKIIRKIKPEGMSIANEIDPDGKTLWLGGADGQIRAIGIEAGKPTGRSVQVAPAPATFKLSSDGKWLYTGNIPADPAKPGLNVVDKPAVIQAVDTATMKVVATEPVGPGTFILGLEVSTDGKQIWSANGNNTITLMDGETHKIVKTITTDFDAAEAVELTPDGKLLLAVGHMGKLSPMKPPANQQAYAQFYSTESFKKVGAPIDLGKTSGGIPVISPH